MLITEITFCWRMMHVHQHVYIPFIVPCYCYQVTSHPSLYVTQLQSFSKILRHALLIWSDSITAIYDLTM